MTAAPRRAPLWRSRGNSPPSARHLGAPTRPPWAPGICQPRRCVPHAAASTRCRRPRPLPVNASPRMRDLPYSTHPTLESPGARTARRARPGAAAVRARAGGVRGRAGPGPRGGRAHADRPGGAAPGAGAGALRAGAALPRRTRPVQAVCPALLEHLPRLGVTEEPSAPASWISRVGLLCGKLLHRHPLHSMRARCEQRQGLQQTLRASAGGLSGGARRRAARMPATRCCGERSRSRRALWAPTTRTWSPSARSSSRRTDGAPRSHRSENRLRVACSDMLSVLLLASLGLLHWKATEPTQGKCKPCQTFSEHVTESLSCVSFAKV